MYIHIHIHTHTQTRSEEVSTEILAITYVNDVQCCCSLRGTLSTHQKKGSKKKICILSPNENERKVCSSLHVRRI